MIKKRNRLPRVANERSVMPLRAAGAIACLALGRAVRPLAPRMLLRAFCTPVVKLQASAEQRAILDAGERFTVRTDAGEATGWRWGRGPAVLLVHGWAGRATQFTSWVSPLTRRGYSVIALDFPAHGESPGSTVHAVAMKDVLLAVAERTGPLAGVVAHSLGGLVSSYAMSQGLATHAMVLISSPAAPGPFFDRLMATARLPRHRRDEVRRGAEAIFGDTFERVAMRHTWSDSTTPALLLHDRFDRQVPFASIAEIEGSIPQAEVHVTEGLGHNRILDDPGVLKAGLDFLDDHQQPAHLQPLDPDFAERTTLHPGGRQTLVSIDEVMADLAYGQR